MFRNRDLTSIDLDYLFLNGSHFKMHDDTNAEPVMVAYAIGTELHGSLTGTTKPSRLRCAARKTTVKR